MIHHFLWVSSIIVKIIFPHCRRQGHPGTSLHCHGAETQLPAGPAGPASVPCAWRPDRADRADGVARAAGDHGAEVEYIYIYIYVYIYIYLYVYLSVILKVETLSDLDQLVRNFWDFY